MDLSGFTDKELDDLEKGNVSALSDEKLAQIGDHPEVKAVEAASDKSRPWYSVTPGGIAEAVKQYIPDGLRNPDKYDWDPRNATLKGTAQATVDAIPGVMAMGGRVLAGPLGAGGGAAAGESLKSAINTATGHEAPQSREEFYGNVAKAGMMGASADMVGESIPAAAKAVAPVAKNAAIKVASTTTGVPEQTIKTYAENPTEINQLAKDAENSPQKLADDWRTRTNAAIDQTKAKLNTQISDTLAKRAGQTVDAQPIIDELNKSRGQINAKLRPEEVAQIDEQIDKVNAVAKDGQIPLQYAHDLKELFQEQAKGAYSKGGQMFSLGTKAANAARAGAAAARQAVNTAAPEVAAANSTLSDLHDISDTMNKNILAEGKTANSVFAAGSGENEANAAMLKKISDVTGTDVLKDAQKVNAAKEFGSPEILPKDRTGKSMTRMAATAGLGYVVGGVPGALGAEALTSPAALKGAVNLADKVSPMVAKAAPVAGAAAENSVVNSAAPQMSQAMPNAADNKPTKGPDKWMNDGFDNLIKHVDDPREIQRLQQMRSRMVTDPKTRELLEQASDMKPGTKAFADLYSRIKTRLPANEAQ